MKQQRLRQTLTLASLFMLLVLPTAIVGFTNLSTLINQAFAKPLQQNEATFLVETESSANIAKGAPFSVKVSTSAPQRIPLGYYAAFIEFDTTKVDIKGIQLQDQRMLRVSEFQNGFLVYPATMTTPLTKDALYPETCAKDKTCELGMISAATISFTVNGVLLETLTEQQRPIQVTIIGASDAESATLWNEKTILPTLNLGEYVRNQAPQFVTRPEKYATEKQEYAYSFEATDADGDLITYTLTCPETTFCTKNPTTPEGILLEGNILTWKDPVYREKPYEITLFANDGKSVSTQTFLLYVLQTNTAIVSCTFTPALTVKLLDYRVTTPLVIVAESSEPMVSAQVTLERNNAVEKEFNYEFANEPTNIILDQNSRPALLYKFSEGTYTGKASITTKSGKVFTCEFTNPAISLSSLLRHATELTIKRVFAAVSAQVNVGENRAPTFVSDPMAPPASGGSSPSVSFVYGTSYSFTLRAKDLDGDPLQHTIVTKPGWAAVAVTSSVGAGGESEYSIQFTGTPTSQHAGSNLFSVSINDGYGHYITRTWVINVDYPNNDIPRVQIITPTVGLTRTQGNNFQLSWDVTDRHQVVSFGIYYTKNLNSTSRTTYNNNVSYNTRGLSINTSSIPPGDYYFIVTATDGFSPPATGSGYTALVRILPKPKPTSTPAPTATPSGTSTPTPTPTASVTVLPTIPSEEPQPDELSIQITSPLNQAEVTAEEFQLVMSVSASSQGEVTKEGVSVLLDGLDISGQLTYSANSGKTLTANYKPTVLLEPGVHQLAVTAKDSVEKSKEVSLTFTIVDSSAQDNDYVDFFGFTIKKGYYTIFLAGLILLAIIALLPVILYFAHRNSEKNDFPAVKRPVTPIAPPPTSGLRTPTTSFATQPANSPTTTAYIPTLEVRPQPAPAPETPAPVPSVPAPIAPETPKPQPPTVPPKQPLDHKVPSVPKTQPDIQTPTKPSDTPKVDPIANFVAQASFVSGPKQNNTSPATQPKSPAPQPMNQMAKPPVPPAPQKPIQPPAAPKQPDTPPQPKIETPQSTPTPQRQPLVPQTPAPTQAQSRIPDQKPVQPTPAQQPPAPPTLPTKSTEVLPPESPALPL